MTMMLAEPALAADTPAKPAPAATPEKLFNAETFKLDNGLQIVVIPDHRAPVVTHMVWYKVGAADELPGKSGVAHFLEHLMFKGQPGIKPGDFSKRIRMMGGEDNAFTGDDYTAFYQSVAASDLEAVMKMEAGRMRGLNPPLREVESERKVIIEERRMRIDNNPGARFNEQLNALLYINHPYSKPVIGWGHEMATLTWADEKSFYDRWYSPSNAILIVAGDVTGQQVYELAKKIYGPIKSFKVPDRVRPSSPPLKGLPEVTLKDPNVREPEVEVLFRAPSARQNKKESLALEVLEEIMGGGPTSRLYKELVVTQKIATGADISYLAETWDDSSAGVYATPAKGADLKAVKAALLEQLRLLVKSGVTDQELKDAKTRMIDDAIYARDSLEGPAMAFGYSMATGASVDDVDYWPRDIGTVTAQDVWDAAKKYLDPDAVYEHAPVTGYLLPENPGGGPAPPPQMPQTGDMR